MHKRLSAETALAYGYLARPEVVDLLNAELAVETANLVMQTDPVMMHRTQGAAQKLTELISEISKVKT